jgi:uncharacterized protein
MIARLLQNEIGASLHQNRAVLLLGARQVGKTTLMSAFTKGKAGVMWLNADEGKCGRNKMEP